MNDLRQRDENRIVLSFDLSHDHDDVTAKTMDAKTRATIEALDSHAIDDEDGCDRRPNTGLLESARQRQMTVTSRGLRNSGDTAGSKDSIVGYGARMFEATQASKAPA